MEIGCTHTHASVLPLSLVIDARALVSAAVFVDGDGGWQYPPRSPPTARLFARVPSFLKLLSSKTTSSPQFSAISVFKELMLKKALPGHLPACPPARLPARLSAFLPARHASGCSSIDGHYGKVMRSPLNDSVYCWLPENR